MNAITLDGTIESISEAKAVGSKGSMRQQLLLRVLMYGKYLNFIPVHVWNEKVNKYCVGQSVTAKINIESSFYQGKYIANLTAFEIYIDARAEKNWNQVQTPST